MKQVRLLGVDWGRGLHLGGASWAKKKASSQQWLARQLADPYVEKAKMLNYRCRSAFKLMEIDDKFKLLSAGQVVLDCGAAPGSWSQVAVSRVNADKKNTSAPIGKVVSVDRVQLYPIEGATTLGNCDITAEKSRSLIMDQLRERRADVVLSDMAPNASGVKQLDQEQMMGLCQAVLLLAAQASAPASILLLKMWQGAGVAELHQLTQTLYESVRFVKPPASRSDSAEIFLLARGMRRLEQPP